MSQTITLNLPESFVQPLERTMRATNQPIEQLLLTALQTALPPLEGLPPEVVAKLEALELLSDDSLRSVLLETVPAKVQLRISQLLQQQETSPLSAADQKELDELQEQADMVMLRKARAAVLLRFRGHRLPTLAELGRLTGLGQ
ncbi:MAG: hypothetical protein AAB401_15260 [Acidobacteriota bacterium]|mgnify:CR=1 FL=1